MRKTTTVDGIDAPVIISRRKGTKSIRISITSNGHIRLSIPHGIPERAAVKFAQGKAEWINKHIKPAQLLGDGMRIGKSYSLHVEHSNITRPSTKISVLDIRVRLPREVPTESDKGQETIRKACEKALMRQAKTLLPQRIEQLSQKHGIDFKSTTIKKLKSRWGACDNLNNIHLNCYLVQLDWSLIDYVICHELAHTIHHNHSAEFWDKVEEMVPDYKQIKKELKPMPTDIIAV